MELFVAADTRPRRRDDRVPDVFADRAPQRREGAVHHVPRTRAFPHRRFFRSRPRSRPRSSPICTCRWRSICAPGATPSRTTKRPAWSRSAAKLTEEIERVFRAARGADQAARTDTRSRRARFAGPGRRVNQAAIRSATASPALFSLAKRMTPSAANVRITR